MYDPDGFAEFARARQAWLLRVAYLLCGDRVLAQDLVQTTFLKLAGAWRRAEKAGSPDAYARRTMLNAYLDHRRRRLPWLAGDLLPDSPVHDGSRDERDVVMKALAKLPPRQRAVLVLRFFDDLSVEQVAETLEIATGTVKSQTCKALDKLRTDPAITALFARELVVSPTVHTSSKGIPDHV